MKLGVGDSPYNPLLCSSLPDACFDTCLSSRRGRVRQTRESLWVYSHGGTGLDGPPFVLHCTAHCRVLPAQQSGHVRYRTAGDLPVDMATFHHLSWHDHVECSRHLVPSWGDVVRIRRSTPRCGRGIKVAFRFKIWSSDMISLCSLHLLVRACCVFLAILSCISDSNAITA